MKTKGVSYHLENDLMLLKCFGCYRLKEPAVGKSSHPVMMTLEVSTAAVYIICHELLQQFLTLTTGCG